MPQLLAGGHLCSNGFARQPGNFCRVRFFDILNYDTTLGGRAARLALVSYAAWMIPLAR